MFERIFAVDDGRREVVCAHSHIRHNAHWKEAPCIVDLALAGDDVQAWVARRKRPHVVIAPPRQQRLLLESDALRRTSTACHFMQAIYRSLVGAFEHFGSRMCEGAGR